MNELITKESLSYFKRKYDTRMDDKLTKKQDVLVSGSNIKTINNESIIGSGNITIDGGGSIDYATQTDINRMFQYIVSKSLTNCSISDNSDYADEEMPYSATIILEQGYSIDYIQVVMGGTSYPEYVSGDTISIPSVTGNIDITASASSSAETWNISYNCVGATFVDGSGDLPASITNGEPLSLSYSLNEDTDYNISVTMDGVDITNSVVDRNNRTMYIPSVTDDVNIWFRYVRELSYSDNIGEDGDPDINIATNYLSGGYTDGDTLSIVLSPVNSGDSVNLTEVTLNGVDITGTITSYAESDGGISFNVTIEGGDLHIEAQVEEEPSYDYTLNTNMVNCWLNNEPEGFVDGEPYDTDVVPDDAGSSLISAEVTMGGVDITNDVWDESNGTISIASVTGDVYIHIEYTEPEPEMATLTFANMENCVLVQDGEPVENGATFPIGEPLELAVVSQGITDAEWFCNSLTMDGVDISETFDGDGNPASIEIQEVTGDIHVEISCSEREEPEEDVPIESIRYTDGQGQTCIGFNMLEGETVDLWTNLEILPADYTDGVEFLSDDDGIIQVDSGGIATATGVPGESTTITISSMGDPSIYTTVEISISDDEPDESEEPEEPDYDYGLNLQLSYCDAPDAPDGFTAGENVDIELVPYQGYTLDFPTKLTITMGGVDITEQAYGYPGASGHAHIYINNVSGDVVAIVSAGEF